MHLFQDIQPSTSAKDKKTSKTKQDKSMFKRKLQKPRVSIEYEVEREEPKPTSTY
jgi:hypothetical protein